jgi:hypothetical protein
MLRLLVPALSLAVLVAGCAAQVDSSAGCTEGAVESCAQDNGNVGARTCGTVHDWSSCDPLSCDGDTVSCTTADAGAGVAQCSNGQSASACGVPADCMPGQEQTAYLGSQDCTQDCTLGSGEWQWQTTSCFSGSSSTPLVLAFHDERVAFTRPPGEFDLAGREASIGSDWVSAGTPWLAMDRDGNGRIDDGRELFGSMTELPDGRAPNGFAALAALDDDGDGAITPADASFARLLVWRDADQDRRSSPGELTSARDAGLLTIRIDYRAVPRCEDGDCEVERARFVFRDATGAEREGSIVDVHLARR